MPVSIEFNADACIGCYACVIACKLVHGSPQEISRVPPGEPAGVTAIRIETAGSEVEEREAACRYQPVACIHCNDAPCIEHCPESAIYRDTESGITSIHEDECTGCGLCLEVCPYHAPVFHDGKIVLCDLCHRRSTVIQGEIRRKTACETACPAKAIRVR